MKKKVKNVMIAAVLMIISVLLAYYVQPYIAESKLGCFISLEQLLFVPFLFFLLSAFDTKAPISFNNRFLFTTLGAICYIVISNVNDFNLIYKKVITCLLGALITYLVLIAFPQKITKQ